MFLFSLQFILRCSSIAVNVDNDSLSNKSFHYRNEFLISINEKKKKHLEANDFVQ